MSFHLYNNGDWGFIYTRIFKRRLYINLGRLQVVVRLP